MRWSIILLVLLTSLIFLSAYLVLNLNAEIVLFDYLFNEIELSLGTLLISSFLFGSLVFLILEMVYFFNKNKNE